MGGVARIWKQAGGSGSRQEGFLAARAGHHLVTLCVVTYSSLCRFHENCVMSCISCLLFPQGYGSLSSPSSGFNVGLPSALPSPLRGPSLLREGRLFYQLLLQAAALGCPATLPFSGEVQPLCGMGVLLLLSNLTRPICCNTGNDNYF